MSQNKKRKLDKLTDTMAPLRNVEARLDEEPVVVTLMDGTETVVRPENQLFKLPKKQSTLRTIFTELPHEIRQRIVSHLPNPLRYFSAHKLDGHVADFRNEFLRKQRIIQLSLKAALYHRKLLRLLISTSGKYFIVHPAVPKSNPLDPIYSVTDQGVNEMRELVNRDLFIGENEKALFKQSKFTEAVEELKNLIKPDDDDAFCQHAVEILQLRMDITEYKCLGMPRGHKLLGILPWYDARFSIEPETQGELFESWLKLFDDVLGLDEDEFIEDEDAYDESWEDIDWLRPRPAQTLAAQTFKVFSPSICALVTTNAAVQLDWNHSFEQQVRPYTHFMQIKNLITDYLPPEMCSMRSLKHLTIQEDEEKLRAPENTCIANLTSLESLTLRGTTGSVSVSLPNDIGDLTSLTKLHVRYVKLPRPLPESIGDLTSLTELSLSKCKSLESLPDSIGRLQALTELNLSDCYDLKSLPRSIGRLQQLKRLRLEVCTALTSLPDTIADCKSLETLNLFGCVSLKSPLLESIGGLESLKNLTVPHHSDFNSKELKFAPFIPPELHKRLKDNGCNIFIVPSGHTRDAMDMDSDSD